MFCDSFQMKFLYKTEVNLGLCHFTYQITIILNIKQANLSRQIKYIYLRILNDTGTENMQLIIKNMKKIKEFTALQIYNYFGSTECQVLYAYFRKIERVISQVIQVQFCCE